VAQSVDQELIAGLIEPANGGFIHLHLPLTN
jgi:hypothetical protein